MYTVQSKNEDDFTSTIFVVALSAIVTVAFYKRFSDMFEIF